MHAQRAVDSALILPPKRVGWETSGSGVGDEWWKGRERGPLGMEGRVTNGLGGDGRLGRLTRHIACRAIWLKWWLPVCTIRVGQHAEEMSS